MSIETIRDGVRRVVAKAGFLSADEVTDAVLDLIRAELTSDAAVNAAARGLALLEPGQDWPTNEALGGNLTGTRDDEYRDAMHDEARDAIRGLIAYLGAS